jgi:hypothetical protein
VEDLVEGEQNNPNFLYNSSSITLMLTLQVNVQSNSYFRAFTNAHLFYINMGSSRIRVCPKYMFNEVAAKSYVTTYAS